MGRDRSSKKSEDGGLTQARLSPLPSKRNCLLKTTSKRRLSAYGRIQLRHRSPRGNPCRHKTKTWGYKVLRLRHGEVDVRRGIYCAPVARKLLPEQARQRKSSGHSVNLREVRQHAFNEYRAVRPLAFGSSKPRGNTQTVGIGITACPKTTSNLSPLIRELRFSLDWLCLLTSEQAQKP